MKFLQIATLVYAFLLSILEEQLQENIKQILMKGVIEQESDAEKSLHRFTSSD